MSDVKFILGGSDSLAANVGSGGGGTAAGPFQRRSAVVMADVPAKKSSLSSSSKKKKTIRSRELMGLMSTTVSANVAMVELAPIVPASRMVFAGLKAKRGAERGARW